MLQLNSPCIATLKNLEISDGNRTTTGIVVNVSNGALWARRTLLESALDGHGAAWLVRNVTNASIDLLDFQFGGSSNGMIVDNSPVPIRMRGGATAGCGVLLTLTNNVNVCIDEMWYENDSDINDDFIHASGAGTFSLSGFNAAVNVNNPQNGHAAIFTNWNGTALISQGGIRDKIRPVSGTGSLWINGLNWDDQPNANPTNGVVVGLATFSYNNVRCVTNNFITPINDYAPVNNALIRSTMALERNTRALQNPPTNAVRFESINIVSANTSVLVK